MSGFIGLGLAQASWNERIWPVWNLEICTAQYAMTPIAAMAATWRRSGQGHVNRMTPPPPRFEMTEKTMARTAKTAAPLTAMNCATWRSRCSRKKSRSDRGDFDGGTGGKDVLIESPVSCGSVVATAS